MPSTAKTESRMESQAGELAERDRAARALARAAEKKSKRQELGQEFPSSTPKPRKETTACDQEITLVVKSPEKVEDDVKSGTEETPDPESPEPERKTKKNRKEKKVKKKTKMSTGGVELKCAT